MHFLVTKIPMEMMKIARKLFFIYKYINLITLLCIFMIKKCNNLREKQKKKKEEEEDRRGL